MRRHHRCNHGLRCQYYMQLCPSAIHHVRERNGNGMVRLSYIHVGSHSTLPPPVFCYISVNIQNNFQCVSLYKKNNKTKKQKKKKQQTNKPMFCYISVNVQINFQCVSLYKKKKKKKQHGFSRPFSFLARLNESTGRAVAVTTASASALHKMLVFG